VVSGTIGGIFIKTILGIADFKPSLSWALMPKKQELYTKSTTARRG